MNRHHTQWLQLLEISGPFLSVPVLAQVFPAGLDQPDSELMRELRQRYAEWRNRPSHPASRASRNAAHQAWIRFILTQALQWPEAALLQGQGIPPSLKATLLERATEVIRPDAVLSNPPQRVLSLLSEPEPTGDDAVGKPRLLLHLLPAEQSLDAGLAEGQSTLKPGRRMLELLRACEMRLGLVTNGEQWMLVDASPGGTPAYISWFAQDWLDEPIAFSAFYSLFRAYRFFSVGADETLEAMLAKSADYQYEVTDQLGLQVRRAVEVLIQSMDAANRQRHGQLLAGVSEQTVYESALTVMMRLVFLLCAEERGLLLLGDPIYDQHYAVSTLSAQLREAADQLTEDVLARRLDAWYRLCALFRAVHGGVQHENFLLPAYGSSLFDPARFPFLEQMPINNRVTLHLLEALQFLRVKISNADGGQYERQKLSFRSLDIEQIGHVYESLLDHTAKRATEVVLGLAGAKGNEPEVALAQLERLADRLADQLADRDPINPQLIAYLLEQTGRSESALRRGLSPETVRANAEHEAHRLRIACGNDEALYQRVLPFAGLIRNDDFEEPVIIAKGSLYMTAGTARRSTGTHYTPQSLTEPIVQHTLEPLVYVGPAEGLPREQWQLRPPHELLQLKVCDMAMGSGAFLVQACRYLAERLVEAWQAIENAAEGKTTDDRPPTTDDGPPTTDVRSSVVGRRSSLHITPEGLPATGQLGEQLIPSEAEERLVFARRIVADRCLYGVDKNPMATEMAKLSLWLITMDRGRPFSFLDHALKCGDSLVGASADDFERWAHRVKDSSMTLFDEQLREQMAAAREKRRALQAFEVREVRDAERKDALLKEADAAMARIKLGCDIVVGMRLLGLKPKEVEARLGRAILTYMDAREPLTHEMQQAVDAARAVRAFHWGFEFPEVLGEVRETIDDGRWTTGDRPSTTATAGRGQLFVAEHHARGFAAFVGNPPFIGGKKISGEFGKPYLEYLSETWDHAKGHADLCAYFFLQAHRLLRQSGTFGLIATNTIAQGDTRERGLDYLLQQGATIYRATNNLPWPGVAAVVVNIVHLYQGGFAGEKVLDGKGVKGISALLDSANDSSLGDPKRLAANVGKSFIGSYVLGMGFVLEPEQAQALIDKDPRNKEVLFPYLNGEDLNSRPDQSPSRWVINFFDWSLEKAQTYPDCLEIVERLVKPERTRLNEKGEYALRKPLPQKWWIYADKRPELYGTIASMKRVLVIALTSRTCAAAFEPSNMVFAHATGVFALDNGASLAIMQSAMHVSWAFFRGSSLKGDLRYTPSDIFETFPFPLNLSNDTKLASNLDDLGENYHLCRRHIMLTRNLGLTQTYNRFHDPKESSADIAQLRALHVEMDHAVAAAYGWGDLVLGHDFHDTAQGTRYTLSEPARREVLDRLLRLNHERAAEEEKLRIENDELRKGSAAGSRKGKGKGKKAVEGQGSLF